MPDSPRLSSHPAARRTGRPTSRQLLWPALVFALVLVVVGTWVVQWLTADDAGPPPPSFADQVDALPFVEEVRTESSRVAGSNATRTLESWVTLSGEDLTSDPAAVAEGLAGVTWGYQQSHWSVAGLPSTAEVRDLGPVAQEPVRWWVDATVALAHADPRAALACRITEAALGCEVDAADLGRVVEALAAVDGSGIEPWLSGVSAEEGEETGFSLRVGGRTYTEATRIG